MQSAAFASTLGSKRSCWDGAEAIGFNKTRESSCMIDSRLLLRRFAKLTFIEGFCRSINHLAFRIVHDVCIDGARCTMGISLRSESYARIK